MQKKGKPGGMREEPSQGKSLMGLIHYHVDPCWSAV